MKKANIITLITFLLLSAGCSLTPKKNTERIPASVPTAQETEVDEFFNEIENAPSARY